MADRRFLRTISVRGWAVRMTLLVLGAMVTTVVAAAPVPSSDERSRFRFELEQTQSHRGPGVHGWVYNDLPWRVTDVRLRVDCLDGSGTVTESVAGWVQGDVSAGDRAYFYVSISSPAAAYRVSVQSFDKVAAPQAP